MSQGDNPSRLPLRRSSLTKYPTPSDRMLQLHADNLDLVEETVALARAQPELAERLQASLVKVNVLVRNFETVYGRYTRMPPTAATPVPATPMFAAPVPAAPAAALPIGRARPQTTTKPPRKEGLLNEAILLDDAQVKMQLDEEHAAECDKRAADEIQKAADAIQRAADAIQRAADARQRAADARQNLAGRERVVEKIEAATDEKEKAATDEKKKADARAEKKKRMMKMRAEVYGDDST